MGTATTATVLQLPEVLDYTDDWTGVSDPVARRKLQNRLNQRARRRRQDPTKSTHLRSRQADVRNGHQMADTARPQWILTTSVKTTATSRKENRQQGQVLSRPQPPFATLPRRNRPDLCFPLSMDHLIHLVQLNVYRAFLANMLSLGRTSLVTCTTDLDDKDGRVLSTVNTSPRMPPALAPTLLQKSTPHAAWIDLFPLPALRDALIRAHGTYDMCALYVDVLGTIGNKTARSDGTVYRQRLSESTSERTGVVVWGEPWRVESWELEEGFVRRWTWLLQNGCDELLRATDRWRQFRGDDMMDWADLGVAGQNALL